MMVTVVPAIRIRRAALRDCYDIWVWRNDPRAKRSSFNKNKISYDEHRSWFKTRLKDENARIYIAQLKNGRKVGQARFDFYGRKKTADINVNLNPRFFGRHLGNVVIKQTTEKYIKENPKVNEIVAMILSENTASKRAFQKAGYLFFKNGHKYGKKTCEFRFKIHKDKR